MNTIAINDSKDFECVCDDILTEFIESIDNNSKYVTMLDPDDDEDKNLVDEGAAWRFTPRGQELYRSYCSKLTRIAKRNFPDEDVFDISSSHIID